MGRGGTVTRILNLDTGWKWPPSRYGRFTPGKECRYRSDRRLGGPQSRSGQVAKRRICALEATRNPVKARYVTLTKVCKYYKL